MAKGLIIAATASGCGKTTLSLGLMAALVRRGLRVVPFKVGPDFIDPGHHRSVTGRTSHNLDGWMLSRRFNRETFHHRANRGEIAVVEGVMGLFDGYDGRSDAGSTAQMAKWLDLPVVLVVDARSMARSAAALVQGFENFDADLKFLGVLFNRIGSARHLRYLKEALMGHVTMPCLGGVPRESSIRMPERHLGLVTAEDHPLSATQIDQMADLIEAHVDLDGLLSRVDPIHLSSHDHGATTPQEDPGPRIGIARDRAFCFYYPENLAILEAYGARLVYFSPLTDATLPEGLDGLYLGGGYPETNARQLAANRAMRTAIFDMSRKGMPIYGECGGFMYLGRGLIDLDGRRHAMTDCFPLSTRMLRKRKALGYREIQLKTACILGPAGSSARGHEFHYSEIETADPNDDVATVYRVVPRSGGDMQTEGFYRRRTLGSYIHLHFGSNPDLARDFVQNCRQYKLEKDSIHAAI
ncbi:MAG: cobyrinate a,c-diamide synthase [Desulfobacterales bacterium]|nr:cobyrinate a,c-diamide synthase [Desulfobacterales bacterium]